MKDFLIVIVIFTLTPCFITYIITRKNTLKKANITKDNLNTIDSQAIKIDEQKEIIENASKELNEIQENISKGVQAINALKAENSEILALKDKECELNTSVSELVSNIEKLTQKQEKLNNHINELVKRNDLYSRVDELISYGHYDTPEYLYKTSDRYAEEIKQIRDKQKEMIINKEAIIYPDDNLITNFAKLEKQIFTNTTKLMLRAFNMECDMLISKVNPSNFTRTLEQISKLASDIEKLAITLEIGFDEDYIDLKMTECELFYHYKLKKQEEQEEQRLLKEQMKEEQKAAAEYQREIEKAKKEEEIYQNLLDRAKKELEISADKEAARLRIEQLERELAEAIQKSQRAQSMAELTKKGYVYIISNIGSFGEDVYKIGMTRRLEPMDRVKELGDASVPFNFDVHAIISCDDAPALEAFLHKVFNRKRVNAVNLRKEFFKVGIDEIKKVLDEQIGAENYDFKTTILAEEYFESRRLLG
ncbi:DUF4041 domain-containing protein [Campylobacter hyointestinalis]|uniref:ATPase n=1 Tax=Campylobacter hyointestinalis subsp. hyointestinalis TaxID=91352 RepID=A0A2S5J525_CAMHY|nr:DUF4041 domain-containing protein [Campylobacter hyointestinalis]PPB54969.1 ATPase [Campylobacter hyointestinalis subsp. hyointestinalis]PPB55459.1 ATPase [Campylobacter hyointestinalis subsp. hyointestinalis]PPB58599.1 ATPase [Campylobacter hyointestinalis subsp. hyointestinalis]PPB60489.1 ATPase [Campylobacter hyointestinalis subsp. hyointestinalis]PPB61903.1 ATPase [Campylobacter hyointestinalis subsp. hyointestinalis]